MKASGLGRGLSAPWGWHSGYNEQFVWLSLAHLLVGWCEQTQQGVMARFVREQGKNNPSRNYKARNAVQKLRVAIALGLWVVQV